MKSLMLYLVVLAGGASVGAFGVGAYNAMTAEPVDEEVAGVDGGHEDEGTSSSGVTTLGDATDEDEGFDSATAGGTDVAGVGDELDEVSPPGVGVDGGSEAVQTTAASRAPPATSSPTTTVAPAPGPDPDSLARLAENYQRLARIFSAMKPDEAAPVLAQLDDEQLEGILLAMQGRNAAPILAEMDPQRAAALSRKVLRGNEP